jgi:hypothetical protein
VKDFLAFKLVDDNTGCEHGLDGPTRLVEGWEAGRCVKCHNEIAYKLSDTGKRTEDVRLLEWKRQKKKKKK